MYGRFANRRLRKGNRMLDVLIIGAGVSGCAIARELSRKKLNIAVVEKNLMCAREPQRQTAALSMRALTQSREL